MARRIEIAKEFSKYPAGRFRPDGEATGEHFRDDLLLPALEDGVVEIVFDGVAGLPSSFLEEALGGLIRKGKTLSFLEQRLRIEAQTPRMKSYELQAWQYIRDAAKQANKGKSGGR
jgi:hypothetical protein